jgi:hypothetical protein
MDETLEGYFRAMQRGPEGEDELIALFAEDAVYIEPFCGQQHAGRDAIRSYLRQSWRDPPPGIRLTVERLEISEQVIEASWPCESGAFSRPARGRDRVTIRYWQIIRLESRLTDHPSSSPDGQVRDDRRLIDALDPPLDEVARALIDAGLPDTTSAIKWAHPTWSLGKHPVCYLKRASAHLTLFLARRLH